MNPGDDGMLGDPGKDGKIKNTSSFEGTSRKA
jgi:hypothetical protein